MKYPKKVQSLLKKADAGEGDEVLIRCGGRTYQGVVMPHHSFSGKEILTIKLQSGYNIGLEVTDDIVLQKVAQGRRRARPRQGMVEDSAKPTLSILGTGGTIASYVDYRTGAVHPALTAGELAFSVPELQDLCNVKARVLFSIFSEDMKVRYWKKLAKEIALELNHASKGVLVPHGTDTLGYTSAALSFMLKNLTGPVILVGAQRSSDRPSSDATLNLLSAARLAPTDLGEVVVVMHEETSDIYCTIHRGTKVRKMHSSRRDAFKSINVEPLGRVDVNDGVTWYNAYRGRSQGPVEVDDKLEDRVALLHTHPNMKPELLDACAQVNAGIVLAGTGLGHVPQDLIPSIKRAIRGGVQVVMTSQCLYGRVGMYVYSRGRELVKAGVIPGEDMLPETALVKLMWVLGHTTDPARVRELMTSNLVGEINPRLHLEEYEA
ncbi:MAG: Glu-tRNA(Gln) amidotransferase subunit GatD [Thermoplasmata archaeon]